jgi:membrane protein YdbS with pleckstrin-like domain
MPEASDSEVRVFAIERADASLLTYYALRSLLATVLFPIFFVPLFFKYHTLRYRFDTEGIRMRWGFLFRREINLTYTRIQDIHVNRGIIERWLGLASLSIQTASGTAGPEMTIVGLKEFEMLRDFLYGRMRGHTATRGEGASGGEALELLRQIHADLAAVRAALRTRPSEGEE